MKRVSKGKLAGNVSGSAESLGFAGLSEADVGGLAAAALNGLSDAALYVGADGMVKACSPSYLDYSGLPAEEVVGKPFKSLGAGQDESNRIAIALLEASAEGGGTVAVKLRSAKSRALPAKAKLTVVAGLNGEKCWLAALSLWIDGERREADKFLSMGGSEFDSTTGMLGRLAFMRAAAIALNRDGFKDRPCVLCMDLNRFGEINSAWGQSAGDSVLEQVAERLKKQLRRGDWAGRMGSDEFCLYVSLAGNPSDARAVAQRIQAALAQPFVVGESIAEVSASIGVAMGPVDGATIDELVCAAERASRRAKAGNAGWSFCH